MPLPTGALHLATCPAEFTRIMDQLASQIEPGDLVFICGSREALRRSICARCLGIAVHDTGEFLPS